MVRKGLRIRPVEGHSHFPSIANPPRPPPRWKNQSHIFRKKNQKSQILRTFRGRRQWAEPFKSAAPHLSSDVGRGVLDDVTSSKLPPYPPSRQPTAADPPQNVHQLDFFSTHFSASILKPKTDSPNRSWELPREYSGDFGAQKGPF